MKKQASLICCYLSTLLLLSFFLVTASLAADDSVCARVKIEIQQEVTLRGKRGQVSTFNRVVELVIFEYQFNEKDTL